MLTILVACWLFWGCNQGGDNRENGQLLTTRIDRTSDSTFLNLCYQFQASDIQLEKCFSNEFKDFVSHSDTLALKGQQNFKLAVILVLEKLYLYHLSCCNQGYNLLDMPGANSKYVTNNFLSFAKLNLGYDNFLNSGYVYEFVEKNPNYLTDSVLSVIHNKITTQINRAGK